MGRLNRLLPKRQFALLGPGRWGSRGDIRLGVPVTYADISNAAILIEIARQKGGYVPDLSFGTHFFQDLVESNIRYLPLYPDDPDVVFNEGFFRSAPNALASLAPDFEALADVLRVIDVPAASGGRVLRILMNGDLDEAVGLLATPVPGGEAARATRAAASRRGPRTTGAGACAWPSASPRSSSRRASGSRRPTCSARPRTARPARRATSTCCSTWRRRTRAAGRSPSGSTAGAARSPR